MIQKIFFQSVSWKWHCMTHWCKQHCLGCKISSNCGKKYTRCSFVTGARKQSTLCLLVAIKFKYLLLHFHWLAVTKFCTWCKFVPFLYFFNKSTTNSNKSTGRTEITLILKIRNQLFIVCCTWLSTRGLSNCFLTLVCSAACSIDAWAAPSEQDAVETVDN